MVAVKVLLLKINGCFQWASHYSSGCVLGREAENIYWVFQRDDVVEI